MARKPRGLPPAWSPLVQQVKAVVGLLRAVDYGRRLYEVYTSWLTMFACSLAAPANPQCAAAIEERYMTEAKRYSKDQLDALCQVSGYVMSYFQHCVDKGEPFEDFLGHLLMAEELGYKEAGQFFTPMTVCTLMARMNFSDDLLARFVKEDRILSVAEPACGGGAMLLAVVNEMVAHGFPYHSHAYFDATDVDARCADMCYIQLSLAGVPALVRHGNTLSGEQWRAWWTPAALLNRIPTRLAWQRQRDAQAASQPSPANETEPQQGQREQEVPMEEKETMPTTVEAPSGISKDHSFWDGLRAVVGALFEQFEVEPVPPPAKVDAMCAAAKRAYYDEPVVTPQPAEQSPPKPKKRVCSSGKTKKAKKKAPPEGLFGGMLRWAQVTYKDLHRAWMSGVGPWTCVRKVADACYDLALWGGPAALLVRIGDCDDTVQPQAESPWLSLHPALSTGVTFPSARKFRDMSVELEGSATAWRLVPGESGTVLDSAQLAEVPALIDDDLRGSPLDPILGALLADDNTSPGPVSSAVMDDKTKVGFELALTGRELLKAVDAAAIMRRMTKGNMLCMGRGSYDDCGEMNGDLVLVPAKRNTQAGTHMFALTDASSLAVVPCEAQALCRPLAVGTMRGKAEDVTVALPRAVQSFIRLLRDVGLLEEDKADATLQVSRVDCHETPLAESPSPVILVTLRLRNDDASVATLRWWGAGNAGQAADATDDAGEVPPPLLSYRIGDSKGTLVCGSYPAVAGILPQDRVVLPGDGGTPTHNVLTTMTAMPSRVKAAFKHPALARCTRTRERGLLVGMGMDPWDSAWLDCFSYSEHNASQPRVDLRRLVAVLRAAGKDEYVRRWAEKMEPSGDVLEPHPGYGAGVLFNAQVLRMAAEIQARLFDLDNLPEDQRRLVLASSAPAKFSAIAASTANRLHGTPVFIAPKDTTLRNADNAPQYMAMCYQAMDDRLCAAERPDDLSGWCEAVQLYSAKHAVVDCAEGRTVVGDAFLKALYELVVLYPMKSVEDWCHAEVDRAMAAAEEGGEQF